MKYLNWKESNINIEMEHWNLFSTERGRKNFVVKPVSVLRQEKIILFCKQGIFIGVWHNTTITSTFNSVHINFKLVIEKHQIVAD